MEEEVRGVEEVAERARKIDKAGGAHSNMSM